MTQIKNTSTSADQSISAMRRVDSWMRIKYGIGLEAMEIAETPGYWQDKEAQIHHGHPLHGCIGCSGPFKATYTYFDNGRSPTKSWRAIAGSR